jgi:hypothetical protein
MVLGPCGLERPGPSQPFDLRRSRGAPPFLTRGASAGYASTDASDHAADPGKPACTTPSATTVEG